MFTKNIYLTGISLLFSICLNAQINDKTFYSSENINCSETVNYGRPFESSIRSAFIQLPAGAVEPGGWLRDWCLSARDGYTGHMDEIDTAFQQAWSADYKMKGEKLIYWNGGWPYEGGGYWLGGLVKLGYILKDKSLIKQAKRRLDVIVNNMNNHGILFMWWLDRNNPYDLKSAEGTNKKAAEWPIWANGLMGRALTGYYAASDDKRVLGALEMAYIGEERWLRMGWSPSNIQPAFDTYTWTGNKKIRKALSEFFVKGFENKGSWWTWDRYGQMPDKQFWADSTDHGVHALESSIWPAYGYLWTGKKEFLDASLRWHDDFERYAMQPYGVPVFDEFYGPTSAFRSTETCDVAGYMWSQIVLLTISGKSVMGDRLERAFFNAAPGTISPDFKTHVYLQSPNRILPENGDGNAHRLYKKKHSPLCCTSSLNRILPNYIMNMWMSTYENGLVATLYGPCKVSAFVADKVPVEITCKTDYPFNETIKLTIKLARESNFPLSFRIPYWCNNPAIDINGTVVKIVTDNNGFFRIERTWKTGDAIHLNFPMTVQVNTGHDIALKPKQGPEFLNDRVLNSSKTAKPYATVSYGPLLFAVPIPCAGDSNTPSLLAKWKYALDLANENSCSDISVERGKMPAKWNWPFDSPLKLSVKAVSFDWNTPNYILPNLPIVSSDSINVERLSLIPYGCTKFRVSMIPVTERTIKNVNHNVLIKPKVNDNVDFKSQK